MNVTLVFVWFKLTHVYEITKDLSSKVRSPVVALLVSNCLIRESTRCPKLSMIKVQLATLKHEETAMTQPLRLCVVLAELVVDKLNKSLVVSKNYHQKRYGKN